MENSALFAQLEQLEKNLPYPDEKQARTQLEQLKNRRELLLSQEKQAKEKFLLLSEEEQEKRGRLASLKENRETLQRAQESSKTTYESMLRELGFSDETEYQKAKMSSEQRTAWQQEIRAMRSVSHCQDDLLPYKEETKGRERIDTSHWEEEAAVLRKNKN